MPVSPLRQLVVQEPAAEVVGLTWDEKAPEEKRVERPEVAPAKAGTATRCQPRRHLRSRTRPPEEASESHSPGLPRGVVPGWEAVVETRQP